MLATTQSSDPHYSSAKPIIKTGDRQPFPKNENILFIIILVAKTQASKE
ncbi:MAG: hypothetical protein WBB82_12000 [Limnothrix sp.]